MPAGFFRAGDDGQFSFCPAGLMVEVSVFPMPRLVMMGNASDAVAGPHDCRCTLRPALHTVQSGMTIGRLLGPFLVECGLRTPHRICEPLRGGRLP